jgi:hypothetical protein
VPPTWPLFGGIVSSFGQIPTPLFSTGNGFAFPQLGHFFAKVAKLQLAGVIKTL